MRLWFWLAALALAGCDNAAAPDRSAVPAQPAASIAEALKRADGGKLLSALDAAELTGTLARPGEYTLLAPTDQAFDKLPAGALDGLMHPAAREQLKGVLSYHLLPGALSISDIDRAIANGGGRAVIATLNGRTLTATRRGRRLLISDQAGSTAVMEGRSEQAGNGVVHRIDAVLMPS